MPLTLYYKEGCSLCQAMREELEPYRQSLGFELTLVDIDREQGLVEQFGHRIPVLAAGESVLCEYFLDPVRLEQYFTGH